MYVISAQMKAKEGQEETIRSAIRAVVPASRAEAGCIMYLAHQDVADPRRFMFYEQYVDEAAFQAHLQTEHYQRWVAGMIAPALEDRARGVYTIIE
jgi:autoinducer 2-degrading protein